MAQSINPAALLAGLAAVGAGAWYFLAGPGKGGGNAGNAKTELREGMLFVQDVAANEVKQALNALRVSKAAVTPPGATGSAVTAVEYTLVPGNAPVSTGADIVGKSGLDAARAAYNAGLLPVAPLAVLLQGKAGALRAVTLQAARSAATAGNAGNNAVAPASILL